MTIKTGSLDVCVACEVAFNVKITLSKLVLNKHSLSSISDFLLKKKVHMRIFFWRIYGMHDALELGGAERASTGK